MVEFVGDFVDGFFQQMSRQELPEFGFGFRKEITAGGRLRVSPEKSAADPSVPENCPGFELREPFLVENAEFDLLE